MYTNLEKIEKHIDHLTEALWFWQGQADSCLDDKRKEKLVAKCDQIERQIDDLMLQAESL